MTAWRTSSHSHGTNCVEVVMGDGARVRDSKNPAGPVLSFSRAEWAAFTGRITRKDQRRVPPARMVPVRRKAIGKRRPGH